MRPAGPTLAMSVIKALRVKYRCPSLYAKDRNLQLAYKKTRLILSWMIGSRKRKSLNGIYAKLRIKRLHVTEAACTVSYMRPFAICGN